MKKVLLGVCLLAGLAMASPKSYHITLSEPATLNGTELKAGDYKLELNGDKVTVKQGGETIEAAVKVENMEAKNDQTSITYDRGTGKKAIEQIRLAGTKVKLVLNGEVASADAAGNRP